MKRIPVVHCIIQSVGSWADGKRLQVLSNRFQLFFQISMTRKYLQVIYKIQQIVKITSFLLEKYSLLIRLYSKKLKRKIKCTEGEIPVPQASAAGPDEVIQASEQLCRCFPRGGERRALFLRRGSETPRGCS